MHVVAPIFARVVRKSSRKPFALSQFIHKAHIKVRKTGNRSRLWIDLLADSRHLLRHLRETLPH